MSRITKRSPSRRLNGLARLARHASAVGTVSVLVIVVACSDSTAPTHLAGAYSATTLSSTHNGSTVDVLAAGGSLSITLADAGTTTGRLVVPASVGGVAIDASMAGTFKAANGTVTFDQTADTFVRNMTFTQAGNSLTGTGVFSGTTISIVLSRATP